jgi:hypothetical protein
MLHTTWSSPSREKKIKKNKHLRLRWQKYKKTRERKNFVQKNFCRAVSSTPFAWIFPVFPASARAIFSRYLVIARATFALNRQNPLADKPYRSAERE